LNRLSATRRSVLGAAFAAAGGAATPLRAATGVPEAAVLMAPGPQEGPSALFAQQAVRGLARALVQASALRVSVVGGPDGITAANRFGTNTATLPVLLLLPGLAAQALLVGDPRARFEPLRWPALAGSLQPAILAGRGAPGSGQAVRLAIPSPAGIGADPIPLASGSSAEAAVSGGMADAAVLSGPDAAERAAALGLTPWFAFDGPAGARDPTLPQVPALGELLRDPAAPELLMAIRAAGTALRVRGLLVLPMLTPANSVALWRDAARRWIDAEPEAVARGTRLLAAEQATQLLATLCPRPDAALAYREWLHRRTGWQPS
jgi:hypothetical protein